MDDDVTHLISVGWIKLRLAFLKSCIIRMYLQHLYVSSIEWLLGWLYCMGWSVDNLRTLMLKRWWWWKWDVEVNVWHFFSVHTGDSNKVSSQFSVLQFLLLLIIYCDQIPLVELRWICCPIIFVLRLSHLAIVTTPCFLKLSNASLLFDFSSYFCNFSFFDCFDVRYSSRGSFRNNLSTSLR